MGNVTIDNKSRMFVIKSGSGFSCLGFDVLFDRLVVVIDKLRAVGVAAGEVLESEIGTLKQYQQYQEIWRQVGNRDLGTFFSRKTPIRVREILEQYRKNGKRIRLFYGDSETGLSWMDEYDVIGTIGRSMGPQKVPLIIGRASQHGGPAILDDCIVRLLDVKSKRELYRHPKFHLPALSIVESNETEYTHEVTADGSLHARFTSRKKAESWIEFMHGVRMKAA